MTRYNDQCFQKIENENNKTGYVLLNSTNDIDAGSLEIRRQSLSSNQPNCISEEEMMFMIKDTKTGIYYDSRMKDTEEIFDHEGEKFAKPKSRKKESLGGMVGKETKKRFSFVGGIRNGMFR